jgi:hypothetical protein
MNDDKSKERIYQEIEEEQLGYKGPHCCLTMDAELESQETVLKYNPWYREYGVKIPKSIRVMLMDYCMFCGKKLPSSVRRQWFDILKEEYELESPMEEDKKKIPREFWTDEWWKKRGL